jgi:hypothetical protein
MAENPALSDKALAAVDLLRRNGMGAFELRFSESEFPNGHLVWMAIADFSDRWEVTAARTPNRAVLRLTSEVVDGAVCMHCSKVCGFDEDYDDINAATAGAICWFQYDDTRKAFRRGCE